jgi:hypothetical protein
MVWNIWLEVELTGLEYFIGAVVKWSGIFGWSWSQMDWNIWLDLDSNGLEFEWARIFGLNWSQMGWTFKWA